MQANVRLQVTFTENYLCVNHLNPQPRISEDPPPVENTRCHFVLLPGLTNRDKDWKLTNSQI